MLVLYFDAFYRIEELTGVCYNRFMKILMPTAKELAFTAKSQLMPELTPQVKLVLEHLSQLSVPELINLYKIKPERAEEEATRLVALKSGKALAYPAWQLFDGLMYRQIQRRDLSPKDLSYLEKHVYITSALYGMLPVFTNISAHRLDFLTPLKVEGKTLKHYWRPHFDAEVADDDILISLLSSEFETVFSKSVQDKMIRCTFMEEKDGQLKKHSTISKKARGKCLNELVKQQVTAVAELKELRFDGFAYQDHYSTHKTLVFVKKLA